MKSRYLLSVAALPLLLVIVMASGCNNSSVGLTPDGDDSAKGTPGAPGQNAGNLPGQAGTASPGVKDPVFDKMQQDENAAGARVLKNRRAAAGR